MTKQELYELKGICIHLGEIIQEYGKKYNVCQIRVLSDIIHCINSNMDEEEKEKYILGKCRLLYPPQGGLNDFYIHNDDFAIRLKLNEPLDRLKEDLWNIIKVYI